MSEAIHAREKHGGNERCAYCHDDFAAGTGGDGSERVACASCGTPHHAECFAENDGCSSLGCERGLAHAPGGAELRVAVAPRADVREPTRSGVSRYVVGLGAILFVVGLAVGVIADGHASLAFMILGGLLVLLGRLARRLGRAAGLRPLERRPPAALRYIQRPRGTGVPILRPSPGTALCPICRWSLDPTAELRACPHCGVSLS